VNNKAINIIRNDVDKMFFKIFTKFG